MSIFSKALQNETLIHPAEDGASDLVVRSTRTDAQLVELVLAGDDIAFESLFNRHKRLVGSIAARYFRQPDQVEEILQITFVKVYQEVSKFRGDHDLSFVGWLARIARNACLDVLRNQKRKPEDRFEDSDGNEPALREAMIQSTTEDLLVDRDLAERLMSHLAADDRALLQMLYAEDMSIADAAEQMGWSVSKVKIRTWRARHSLRRIVKRYL